MLTPLNEKRFDKPASEFTPGPAPQLEWLKVSLLFVDGSYQRGIGRLGAANVRHIAEAFDWSKFAPVIVAPIEGGIYAIVDGQHRTTAAILRGIEKVPCQIVLADREKQAAAFAAVNGNVTKTTPTQIFFARLAAKCAAEIEVAEVCKASDVMLARTNLTIAKMRPGQTVAVSTIRRCIATYGRDIMVTALRCITRTADGNAGFLRASIIESMAKVLHRHPDWLNDEPRLLQILNRWNWPDEWGKITESQTVIYPATFMDALVTRLEKFLTKQFALPPQQAAIRKRAA